MSELLFRFRETCNRLMENCVEGGLAQARDLLAETSSAAQK